MTCAALGCWKRRGGARQSFCASHWKQLATKQRPDASDPATLRSAIVVLGVLDGYFAPDPLLKPAVIREAPERGEQDYV